MKCKSDNLQSLYDYWNDKRGSRKAPARSDIDPLDFVKLLPCILMYDVLRDPLDFRMRLFGTRLVSVSDQDFTGKMLNQIFPNDVQATFRKELTDICETFEPSVACYDGKWMSKDFVSYERLILPLSEDDKEVNILLGCVIYSMEPKV